MRATAIENLAALKPPGVSALLYAAYQRGLRDAEPDVRAMVALRLPKIFNLRTDPFERADITSNTYWDWMIDRVYLTYAAQYIVREFLGTFKEFPPRMKPASFTVDDVLKKITKAPQQGRVSAASAATATAGEG